MKHSFSRTLYLGSALLLVLVAACFSGCIGENKPVQEVQTTYEWLDTPLTDVTTGEKVTLRELTQDGTPIILHLFATWCPYCNMQLGESTTFLQTYSGKAHVVAVDIDPSENAKLLADHVSKNAYEGTFVIAEDPVMIGLMSLFGEDLLTTGIPHNLLISGDNLVDLGAGVRNSDILSSQIDQFLLQLK
jgi:thiol-disulfide isomerase/thioredoxin